MDLTDNTGVRGTIVFPLLRSIDYRTNSDKSKRHQCMMDILRTRTKHFSSIIIVRIAKLWHSLPTPMFSDIYNLVLFKELGQVQDYF